MNVKASILYAKRMLLSPSNGFGEKSSASRSLFGAVLCIALSLIPLVLVLTVSDGMIEGITSRIVELSSYHMQVNISSGNTFTYEGMDSQEDKPTFDFNSAEGIEDFAAYLQKTPGVVAAFPERQGIGLAAGSIGRTGATIRAVPPEIFAPNSNFSQLFTAEAGSLNLSDKKNALIGTGIAKTLGLEPGDSIRLVTMRTSPTGRAIPKITSFTVEGIISCGYQELDALWVFIPFETGFTLLEGSLSTVLVGIQTADAFGDEFLETAWQVEQELPPNCRLRLWSQLNTTQFENFSSTRIMLIFVMFLIVLVASVNISSALVMLSMERRREIAILKSVGATTEGIITSFLLTGFFAGGLGVVLGIPLGILCAVNVNGILSGIEQIINIFVHFWYTLEKVLVSFGGVFSSTEGHSTDFIPVQLLDPAFYLEEIPVVLPWEGILIIAAGTLVLSVVVSALPSIKAGKEKPLDTLRKF